MKIPDEVLRNFRNGFDDEHYLVSAINVYLVTPTQRQWLWDNNSSIEDILNGRIEGGTPQMVLDMFVDWNYKLGFESFHE